MTRAELFAVFPRPWRVDDEQITIRDARGGALITLRRRFTDEQAEALAALLVALVNGAAEDGE